MDEDPPEIRSWLSEVLSKRVRRPALEETIFHQLDELERGPLEQLASLVHMVIDELRVAGQRLNDQARDLRSLRETVGELNERVSALAAAAPATQDPVDPPRHADAPATAGEETPGHSPLEHGGIGGGTGPATEPDRTRPEDGPPDTAEPSTAAADTTGGHTPKHGETG